MRNASETSNKAATAESPKVTRKVRASIKEYPKKFSYDSESGELHVGSGRIGPIELKAWDYEISGSKVLESWLGYRMKKPKGRKSSKLDDIRPQHWSADMTTTLISLVWILETTLGMEPELESILQTVIKSECFHADELPKPPKVQKKPPRPPAGVISSLDFDGETQDS